MNQNSNLMKNLIFIFLLSSFSFNAIFGAPLAPNENASVYEHLVEVNSLWHGFEIPDIDNLELDQCITFENDTDRIQHHLILVQQILNLKKVAHLSKNQLVKRRHHLTVLANYYAEKQFPINSYHDSRQPYFVDKFGIACAVGYLLLEDGQDEFVQKIVADNNYAYVMDMDYSALNSWAKENGFTKTELALIQPGYGPAPRDYYPIGNNLGIDGKINKLLTSHDDELLYMAGNFDVVDGEAGYNSIAAWNGNEWLQLGDGVNGEILDMTIDGIGNLYVVGNFSNPNNPNRQNIAVWDGTTWKWRQEGNMNGSVHTVYATHPNNVIVGGDFTMINNQPVAYIARNADEHIDWDDDDGKLTLDGPVYAIENIANNLLFGGDFTMTNPIGAPDYNQLSVNNLVYWDYWNWVGGFEEEEVGIVQTIDHINGKLYIGGAIDDGSYYSVLEAGLWTHLDENNCSMDTLGAYYNIGGCIEWEDQVLMYGGFRYYPFVGTFGMGLIDVTQTYAEGVTVFRGGGVNASAIYKDEIYFAGDFYEVGSGSWGNNFTCNNITKTTFSPPTSTEPIVEDESKIKVFYSNESLNIEYYDLREDALLTIYDLSGRTIHETNLTSGGSTSSLDISHLSKGAYAVSIRNEKLFQSEMVVVY